MDMTDVIFWYTGIAAWGVIAILMAIVVIIAIVIIYMHTLKLTKLYSIFGKSDEERQAICDALNNAGFTKIEIDKLLLCMKIKTDIDFRRIAFKNKNNNEQEIIIYQDQVTYRENKYNIIETQQMTGYVIYVIESLDGTTKVANVGHHELEQNDLNKNTQHDVGSKEWANDIHENMKQSHERAKNSTQMFN